MSVRFPSIYARSRRTPVRQYVSDSHDDRKTMADIRGVRTMPLTAKGEEIKAHLEQEYGKKKGEQVLYAGKNKGTFTGIDADETKGEQSSEDARMSVIEGRLSEVEGKKGDAEDVFDSVPAGLDPVKLDAACTMMDALGKRFDAYCAARKDARQSEEERIANQRSAFGFVPGGAKTYTPEKRNPGPEMVPLGNGKSIERSKVNPVTKSLLGWK